MKTIRLAGPALALALCAPVGAAWGEAPEYRPIPPGHDMPAGRAAEAPPPGPEDWRAGEAWLQDRLAARDWDALRGHAWQVFAGLTSPTPEGWAVWESWFTADQVYAGPGGENGDGAASADLESRRADIHPALQHGFGFPGGPEPEAGESVAANVLFNRPARDHIWETGLWRRETLPEMNRAFDAAGTPLSARRIPDFPHDAVALKTIWMTVPAEGVGALPVWDGELDIPALSRAPSLPADVWMRCVGVSAEPDLVGASRDLTCNGHALEVEVIGLERFYNFEILPGQVAAVRAALGDETVEAGDHAVLMGMHFTTREIENWVWGTAWWHDRPGAGPFGAGRPEGVTGAWRNYRLDAAYSREWPRASDGGPNDVFNPYIEGKYPNGLRTNCMSCHARAVYPRLPKRIEGFDMFGALPVVRGTESLPFDSPLLEARTRLSFLWSLMLRTQAPLSAGD